MLTIWPYCRGIQSYLESEWRIESILVTKKARNLFTPILQKYYLQSCSKYPSYDPFDFLWLLSLTFPWLFSDLSNTIVLPVHQKPQQSLLHVFQEFPSSIHRTLTLVTLELLLIPSNQFVNSIDNFWPPSKQSVLLRLQVISWILQCVM